MARQRMIHPDFFIDEDVAMLSPWARLLLISLLTQADREGRLSDKEKRIQLRTFPWDRDVDISGHLAELVEQGFIVRYAVGGGKYISIRNFLKFQKPHPKEAASTIPAPPVHAGEVSGRAGKSRSQPEDSAGVGIRNTESESKPESTEQAVGRAAPPNPLVDRDRLVAEGYDLVTAIAPLENLDPTEVLNKASEWRGRGYVRLDSMSEDRLAHTLNALRRWHRRITGQSEPTLPAARAAPSMTPLTEKLVATMLEIRGGDGGEVEGESGGVLGGAARHRLAPAKAG
jgi:hypothetical protein